MQAICRVYEASQNGWAQPKENTTSDRASILHWAGGWGICALSCRQKPGIILVLEFWCIIPVPYPLQSEIVQWM